MKPVIAVIFGGTSPEHEVSCMSVQNVVSNIDTDKYEFILVGITKQGKWLLVDTPENIKNGTWRDSYITAVISPDATKKALIVEDEDGVYEQHIDLVYPVIHGMGGEDGTIQGLCELAQIPYVGCGILASAVSMDKLFTKIIVDQLGIRQAEYVAVNAREFKKNQSAYISQIESKLDYPVFIKPARGGSSCGVSCAHNVQELALGLVDAANFDDKILVEETIVGREVECAVIGGGRSKTQASGVGEIIAAATFYDYDAKYNNPESITEVHPDINSEIEEEIRRDAIAIFDAIDGYGLSRVDFFLKKDGTVIFNEINTNPGFTEISMWPMLWEAAGLNKRDQVQTLISLGLER